MGFFRKALNVGTLGLTSHTAISAARKVGRLSTLGLVGDSPKNHLRHEQAKTARAEAKLANERAKAVRKRRESN